VRNLRLSEHLLLLLRSSVGEHSSGKTGRRLLLLSATLVTLRTSLLTSLTSRTRDTVRRNGGVGTTTRRSGSAVGKGLTLSRALRNSSGERRLSLLLSGTSSSGRGSSSGSTVTLRRRSGRVLTELLRRNLTVRTHRRHTGHVGRSVVTGNGTSTGSRLSRVTHRSSSTRLRVTSGSSRVVHRSTGHVRRDTRDTSSLLKESKE